MNSVQEEVLILVNVAPTPPYPELFRTGPMQTWFRDSVPGIRVMTLHGKPVGRLRRDLSDLRMMLKFPLSSPSAIGTVDSDSLLMQWYHWMASLARQSELRNGSAASPGSRFTRVALILASRFADIWDSSVTSFIKNRHRAWVQFGVSEVLVGRAQTINNSMAIRMDVLKFLTEEKHFKGVVFVTTSAYIEQKRLLHWISSMPQSIQVAGSNALPVEPGGKRFLSGFFMYFSWSIIEEMASARDFDHSLPDDGAITKWLEDREIAWADPGIEWGTDLLAAGTCPLCANPQTCIVRCTTHGEREREARFMQFLHHNHESVSAKVDPED